MRRSTVCRCPVLLSWTFSTDVVTVTATSTERKAPTRLRMPARRTAVLGFSAPVAIDVAIAFPVSWNPLVKSNASAVAISSTRMIISALMALIPFPQTSIVRSPIALGHSCPVAVPQVHAGHPRWVRPGEHVEKLAATVSIIRQLFLYDVPHNPCVAASLSCRFPPVASPDVRTGFSGRGHQGAGTMNLTCGAGRRRWRRCTW